MVLSGGQGRKSLVPKGMKTELSKIYYKGDSHQVID